MKRILTAAAVFVFVGTTGALAHHPFAAEYDWKRPVTITGTVTSFDWKNPHSLIGMKGKDDKGSEGEWTIELGGPAQLTRAGWKRNELKAGDRVTVEGWLAKNGDKKVSAKSVMAPNGRELFAGSSFFQSEQQAAANARSKGTAATSGQTTPKPVR